MISSEQSYLGRALGANSQVEIDYLAFKVEKGDTFVLATDGIYEHVGERVIARVVKDGAADLEQAAKAIVELAYELGSNDNLTVQIVRVDELPDGAAREVFGQPHELPLPPLLEARQIFDGYRIIRELHGSSRSHIYLAVDIETEAVGDHQDPVDRPARRPRLPEAVHDGRVGSAADRQPACAEALSAAAQAQLPLCRRPNSSTARR